MGVEKERERSQGDLVGHGECGSRRLVCVFSTKASAL